MATLAEKFVKADYIARCAERFQVRGGMGLEVSLAAAEACFSARLPGSTPEEDADADLECWEDDGSEVD